MKEPVVKTKVCEYLTEEDRHEYRAMFEIFQQAEKRLREILEPYELAFGDQVTPEGEILRAPKADSEGQNG